MWRLAIAQEGIGLCEKFQSHRYVPIEGVQAYACAPSSFLAGSAKNESALKQDATKGVGRVGE